MQTTVNFLPGGNLPNGGHGLSAYNNSIVNVSGGIIGDFLYAYDSSTVTVSGGTIVGPDGSSGETHAEVVYDIPLNGGTNSPTITVDAVEP